MRKKIIEVTCDVCGKKNKSEESEPERWRHEVWVKVTADQGVKHLCTFKMDVCDECMDRQTALEGKVYGSFSFDKAHDVKFRDGR